MDVVPHEPPLAEPPDRPRLVFFYSPLSGRCRHVEAFIAQVLQRRHNHETFDLVRVSVERRIVSPRGCRELERELEPWLR